MINKVILMGRITRDLEIRQTKSGISSLSFNLAVDRSYAKQGEERQTDFINCVAWRSTAEFINRYFSKGRMIAIVGEIQTRTYDDKNGVKHYITEVKVNEASFTGEPKQQGGYSQSNHNQNSGGYEQNNGGYAQDNGYNNNRYSQPQQNNYQSAAPQPDSSADIDNFQDFEEYSDDGVPF